MVARAALELVTLDPALTGRPVTSSPFGEVTGVSSDGNTVETIPAYVPEPHLIHDN